MNESESNLAESDLIVKRRSNFKNRIGKRYGKLTVVSIVSASKGLSKWKCVCDCGNESIVGGCGLAGGTKSCGCLVGRTQKHGATAGDKPTQEYTIWAGMRTRCGKKGHKNYAGRGIRVCNRWIKFENFLADMGKRPSPEHSVERKNRHGNYCPSNCIWATSDIQQNNRINNRIVEFGDFKMTLSQWSKKTGLPAWTIGYRISAGWEIKRALTEPVDIRKQRY